MSRINALLDHPVTKFLVIGCFSVASAHLFWKLGGGLAKAVGKQEQFGVQFEVGGALAGFIIVFLVSVHVIKSLQPAARSEPRKVKVFLIPRALFEQHDGYSCMIHIYDDESGDERTVKAVPHRENGHLTIDLHDLGDNERFLIEMSGSNGTKWRSEYHHPGTPRAEMAVA
jgi:hypothetical protein